MSPWKVRFPEQLKIKAMVTNYEILKSLNTWDFEDRTETAATNDDILKSLDLWEFSTSHGNLNRAAQGAAQRAKVTLIIGEGSTAEDWTEVAVTNQEKLELLDLWEFRVKPETAPKNIDILKSLDTWDFETAPTKAETSPTNAEILKSLDLWEFRVRAETKPTNADILKSLGLWEFRVRTEAAPKKQDTAKTKAGFEMHTLAVKNLHKRFGRKEVVRGVNFTMKNGEVAGLLGPNGAGKTTIFYMIVGFYQPNQGIVTLDDANITSLPMYRRARQGIAYLPQEASIFRKLTVEQNIWAILESRRDIDKAARKERLEQLLAEFNIGRIRTQYGYTLSGGERRRTEIARALATEPKFLLLDEPFAGIDPIAVYEIKQIIRRLAQKGIGVLITDHNVRDTLEITTEAFIIADGTIVARGDRDVILANEMVREVYLGNEFRM